MGCSPSILGGGPRKETGDAPYHIFSPGYDSFKQVEAAVAITLIGVNQAVIQSEGITAVIAVPKANKLRFH